MGLEVDESSDSGVQYQVFAELGKSIPQTLAFHPSKRPDRGMTPDVLQGLGRMLLEEAGFRRSATAQLARLVP